MIVQDLVAPAPEGVAGGADLCDFFALAADDGLLLEDLGLVDTFDQVDVASDSLASQAPSS